MQTTLSSSSATFALAPGFARRGVSGLSLSEVARLFDARRVGRDKWMARCPGPLHRRGDRNPSLSIAQGRNGSVVLHCFSGCDVADILAARGLSFADLAGDRAQDRSHRVAPARRRVTRSHASAVRSESRGEHERRVQMLREQWRDTAVLLRWCDQRCRQLAAQLRAVPEDSIVADQLHASMASNVAIFTEVERARDEIDAALRRWAR